MSSSKTLWPLPRNISPDFAATTRQSGECWSLQDTCRQTGSCGTPTFISLKPPSGNRLRPTQPPTAAPAELRVRSLSLPPPARVQTGKVASPGAPNEAHQWEDTEVTPSRASVEKGDPNGSVSLAVKS
ncbi:UNVERIFIED_CONTAM: hypothetical protein K2H54_072251 [Gekko kuhli]